MEALAQDNDCAARGISAKRGGVTGSEVESPHPPVLQKVGIGPDFECLAPPILASSAQMLAQTRPGARGALLLHGCVPTSEFEAPGRTLSHSRSTRWTPTNGWNSTSQKLVEEIENAELFLYPGDGHLCADDGLDDYDEEAAGLLKQRVLAFLERVG